MTVAALFAVGGMAGCTRSDAPPPDSSATADAAASASPAEIVIPGERLITESLTSTSDGSVIIGSVLGQTIFKAAPGSGTAEAWIQPGTNGMAGVFGVFADEASGTLWACSGSFGGPPQPGAPPPPPSALHAFDLASGTPKGKWDIPTAGGFCNDIAVDAAGNAYVTDTQNMEVAKLAQGGDKLEVWAGAGEAFGPKGSVLDGIAVLGDKVVVNALRTGKLFVAPIGADGKAGTVSEVALDRPLEGPDGHRSWGASSLLVAEGTAPGKLSRVDFSGPDLATGTVTTLKEGFPDGAVAVTVVGETAYVLEGQLSLVMGPPDPNAAPKPFKATAVPVGAAP
jgi:sugar lactone lactonase YvrE